MRNFLLTVAAALIGLAPTMAMAQSAPSNYTWATRYDLMGRVTGTIAPDADGVAPFHYLAVRNTYDDAGRLIRVEKGDLTTWQSEAVAPANWTNFSVFSKVETSYDGLDRKTVEANWGWNSATSAWEEASVTQYSYDPVGRLQCSAQRMNPSTWSSLPASACTLTTTSTTYGDDRVTQNIYDDAGQLTQVRKAVGTSIEQAYATYSYTNNGKQQDVIDANGNHAKFIYDDFDRLYQWQFPSTTRPTAFNGSTPANALSTAGAVNTNDYEQYGYDLNGNRTSLRKRDGRTFSFSYDNLNRVTVKTVPDGACPTPYTCTAPASSATRDVYTGYDAWGRQTFARFDSASGSDGITNQYDAFGRLQYSIMAMGGVSRRLDYQWDPDGNRWYIKHPDIPYFTTDYDQLERPYRSSWTNTGGTTQFMAITYDVQGRRGTINRASSYTDYGYDPVSRLSSQVQRFAGGAGNLNTGLSYNPVSQIVGQTRDNTAYAFSGYATVSRNYTTNGLNQYSAAGSAAFGYDSNGNLTSDGTNSYSYDAENRLIGMSGGKTLVYDPNGRLYSVASSSGTTTFLYDGDELAAEYNGSGALTKRYMFAGEDEPILEDTGGALDCSGTKFLHTDHQGSIVALADCWGNRTNVDSYDEYGIPSAANVGRFQYTGQAWLPEIGMDYYKARIYSPTLGRFLQTDPVGYKDQINLYEYVGDDPVNHTDPSGEELVGAIIGVATGAGIDYATQVLGNLAEGKDLKTSLTDVDGKSIILSGVTGGVAGATGLGLTTLGGKFLKAERAAVQARNALLRAKVGAKLGYGARRLTRLGQQAARTARAAKESGSAAKSAAAATAVLKSGEYAAKKISHSKDE